MAQPGWRLLTTALATAFAAAACADSAGTIAEPGRPAFDPSYDVSQGSGGFSSFTPIASSAVCTSGGNPVAPFLLPAGFGQTIIAREGDGGTVDLWDMHTQNETGPSAGRFLYRSHEVGSNGQVSVQDLRTRQVSALAQRADWERLDGIVWTPWNTILVAEEVNVAAFPDPDFPQATAGLIYEIDPRTGAVVARPALGSRSHEGMRFDKRGNLYGIAESSPPNGGYIYKFVPDRAGDLSSGQLYALKITKPTGDRTGGALWIPLDRTAVQVNSDVEATRVGATGYARPEDIENETSTGNAPPGFADVLFIAITGEHRIIGVELDSRDVTFVFDYVKAGVNAPSDFEAPDNLALDRAGNLFIAEDPGGSSPAKVKGDDIWVAKPGASPRQLAPSVDRFATLTDCDAEPSGVYLNLRNGRLFVHVMHRGGDGVDYGMVIYNSNEQ